MHLDTCALLLNLEGIHKCFNVSAFDGCGGQLGDISHDVSAITSPLFLTGTLNLGTKKVWEGTVQVTGAAKDARFELCVVPAGESSAAVPWKVIPSALSLFDGGYSPLSPQEVSILLDNLIEFHELVRSRLHFNNKEHLFTVSAKFTDQDGLKQLSEILFEWASTQPAPPPGTIVLAELELFELSYFLIGTLQDADAESAIISLTSHVYRQHRRSGRRIPLQSIRCGDFDILEVSDFGMKIAAPAASSAVNPGASISIPICDRELRFRVVSCSLDSDRAVMGLQFEDTSSAGVAVWQDFLLKFQYPLLTPRKHEDHEANWSLLEESGYLKGDLGALIADAKQDVLKEWSRIDESGPRLGRTVLGFSDGRPVATIGISRVAGSVWAAQSAAAIDRPEYLPFTRSIYGWRTRAILQQPDGEYHVAFFHRDKPFLDRFFRKFYLQKGGNTCPDITWSEWKYYALAQPILSTVGPPPFTSAQEPGTSLLDEPLFRILLSARSQELQLDVTPSSACISGRPFLHLCQYFTSYWAGSQNAAGGLNAWLNRIEPSQPFVTIRTRTEQDLDWLKQALPRPEASEANPSLIFDGWEVVWTCHRRLLPEFLGNSLRALELMIRKYRNHQEAA